MNNSFLSHFDDVWFRALLVALVIFAFGFFLGLGVQDPVVSVLAWTGWVVLALLSLAVISFAVVAFWYWFRVNLETSAAMTRAVELYRLEKLKEDTEKKQRGETA